MMLPDYITWMKLLLNRPPIGHLNSAINKKKERSMFNCKRELGQLTTVMHCRWFHCSVHPVHCRWMQLMHCRWFRSPTVIDVCTEKDVIKKTTAKKFEAKKLFS